MRRRKRRGAGEKFCTDGGRRRSEELILQLSRGMGKTASASMDSPVYTISRGSSTPWPGLLPMASHRGCRLYACTLHQRIALQLDSHPGQPAPTQPRRNQPRRCRPHLKSTSSPSPEIPPVSSPRLLHISPATRASSTMCYTWSNCKPNTPRCPQ